MSKSEARARVYKRLETLTDKKIRSEKIAAKLLSIAEIERAESIAAYLALDNEVDLDGFIKNLSDAGKTVSVPVTKDEIEFSTLKNDTKLKAGKFGVREPVDGAVCEKFDLIIVPMVAFDAEKNRLGHGKGYYDKFLEGRNIMKVGVAFETQEENFPTEKSDIKMDIIVTEERIIR